MARIGSSAWACFLCTFKTGDIGHLQEHISSFHLNTTEPLSVVSTVQPHTTTKKAKNFPKKSLLMGQISSATKHNSKNQEMPLIRKVQPKTSNKAGRVPAKAIKTRGIANLAKNSTLQPEPTIHQLSNTNKSMKNKKLSNKDSALCLNNNKFKLPRICNSLKTDKERKSSLVKSIKLKSCYVALSPMPFYSSNKKLLRNVANNLYQIARSKNPMLSKQAQGVKNNILHRGPSCVLPNQKDQNLKHENKGISQNNSPIVRPNPKSESTISQLYGLSKPKQLIVCNSVIDDCITSSKEEIQIANNSKFILNVPNPLKKIKPWLKPEKNNEKPMKSSGEEEVLNDSPVDVIDAVFKDICNKESDILNMLKETLEIPIKVDSQLEPSQGLSMDIANECRIVERDSPISQLPDEPMLQDFFSNDIIQEIKKDVVIEEIIRPIPDTRNIQFVSSEENDILNDLNNSKRDKIHNLPNEPPIQRLTTLPKSITADFSSCQNVKANTVTALSMKRSTEHEAPAFEKRIQQKDPFKLEEEVKNKYTATHTETEVDRDNNISTTSNNDQLAKLPVLIQCKLCPYSTYSVIRLYAHSKRSHPKVCVPPQKEFKNKKRKIQRAEIETSGKNNNLIQNKVTNKATKNGSSLDISGSNQKPKTIEYAPKTKPKIRMIIENKEPISKLVSKEGFVRLRGSKCLHCPFMATDVFLIKAHTRSKHFESIKQSNHLTSLNKAKNQTSKNRNLRKLLKKSVAVPLETNCNDEENINIENNSEITAVCSEEVICVEPKIKRSFQGIVNSINNVNQVNIPIKGKNHLSAINEETDLSQTDPEKVKLRLRLLKQEENKLQITSNLSAKPETKIYEKQNANLKTEVQIKQEISENIHEKKPESKTHFAESKPTIKQENRERINYVDSLREANQNSSIQIKKKRNQLINSQSNARKRHMKSFSCMTCGQICHSLKFLRFHYNMFHTAEKFGALKEVTTLESNNQNGNFYFCSVCFKSFSKEENLKSHALINHSERKGQNLRTTLNVALQNTKLFRFFKPNVTDFQCQICEKYLSNKGSLLRHNKRNCSKSH